MGDQKKGKRRKYANKECYAENVMKKQKFTNDLEAEKVSICLDSSSTEEVIQEESNVMDEETTSPTKLNNEILIIDEGGNIYLSSDIVNIMGDQKKGKRKKYANKECCAENVMKKLKFTNDLEAEKVRICLDSSSAEEVDQYTNVMEVDSTVSRKLNDEILIIDEGGNISLSSDTLNIVGDRKKEKRKYVNKERYTKNATKKLKPTNDLKADEVSICLDSSSTEKVIQEESNVMEEEATSPTKLNGEILIIDEGGHISLLSDNNLAEFENSVELPVVAEDVMFVDEAGVTYGSLINYPEEVHLEIVKKNAANGEQAESEEVHLEIVKKTVANVDQAESIFVIESDSVFPSGNPKAVHEQNDEDLEIQMKINRLKEEISSLEEQIKYIESLGSVDSNS